jgi:hypothetical protein
MGRKTEEKIDAIKVALLKWKSVGDKVSGEESELKRALVERDKLDGQNEKYFKSKGWDKKPNESEMRSDQAFQKLQKEEKQAYADVAEAHKSLTGLHTDLKASNTSVLKLLEDFEKFINEKDKKTSDPGKKKSVPAARAFVKEVRAALA